MEWNYSNSKVILRIEKLLKTNRWNLEDDIRIVSDYNGEIQMYGLPREVNDLKDEDNLYSLAANYYKDVSKD